MIKPLRRTARWLIKRAEKLAHPVRRARAQRALARRDLPGNILFVCHGNICRSPYAAHAFERMLPEYLRARVHVESAGLIGPGRGAPQEALAVAARRAVDLAGHQSRLVSHELVQAAELVVVMDTRQRATLRRYYGCDSARILVLGDVDPEATGQRTIRDPIGQSEAVFDASYARIDRCLTSLMSSLLTS